MKYINKIQRSAILLALLLVGWAICSPVSAQIFADAALSPSANITGTGYGTASINEEGTALITNNGTEKTATSYTLNVTFSDTDAIYYIEYSSYSASGGWTAGSWWGSSTPEIAEGENVSVMYGLNSGYKFTSITINGVPQDIPDENSGILTFTMPSADINVVITTESQPRHSLNVSFSDTDAISYIEYSSNSASSGWSAGSWWGSSTPEIAEGENVSVRYSLNPGYKFASITINGVPQNIPDGNSGYLEFTMPSADINVVITTESLPKHTLSVELINKSGVSSIHYSSNSSYGSSYESFSTKIVDGERVDISYSLSSGYKCTSVTLNGEAQSLTKRSFNFVMPESDVKIVIDTEFDPASPADPQPADTTVYYSLTLVSNPLGAGSTSGAGKYAKGSSINVRTSSYSGYTFTGWSKDGEIISNKNSFSYTMPASDVVLTANYVYNPSSPDDPLQPTLKHPLSAIASPAGAGTFSSSGSEITNGTEYYVSAHPKTGYKFKGWIVNGVAQEETSTTLHRTMTEAGASVVALFVFDPSSPANPGANYYNPTTGQAIIDDFTPNYFYSALSNTIGRDNYSNVSSLIVKGRLESGDYNYLSYVDKATTIDLSRTGGATTIPSNTFQSMAAANILLSSEITNIGNDAFRNCENLTALTLYALAPPTCSSYTFYDFTNKENCTVYVPASSIELYSTADYWKDFTILPISTDAHVLQVNLPAEAADGRYKHNSLEIINVNSGVRQKYVISDRLLYTFNGLRKDEQFNIYMYSQSGLEIGRIENVTIPDQDIEVAFENLKTLHTVSAQVLAPDGSDITSQVAIEWLKPLADGTITYLRKANSISEVPDGQQLLCRVSLDDKLGVVYLNPADVEFTASEEQNICTITLSPFRAITLTGTVLDSDGMALPEASVSLSQTLNGKYIKTFTTRTDRKGAWSTTVLDAPETRITYAATECINVNDTIGAFDSETSSHDAGRTTLKSIVGARITYEFLYLAAGADEVETYYSDYQNVAFSVFNVTQNRAHNEVSLQYPTLAVLDDNINAGDSLKLTATSKTGAFNPIVQTVTIGENQRAEVTFDIIGKGGISASFEMTDNPSVIAMLYSSKGELLEKTTYYEAATKFTELADGDYTLITMGQSDLMNSILRLSNFAEIGLTEGKDYVKNSVTVESGKLTEIKNKEIPAFDESLFYYTNSSTSFSSNKSSITTGNYLTLRSSIDFKGAYKNDISNVALIVDMPEACDFVEQSVIQGPNLLPYTLDGNRLTIQLGNDYKSQVRFCAIPTTGGNFNATASVVFDYNGKTITQPIGAAVAEVKDIEITVPSIIAGNTFKVTGTALAKSEVKVYEDGTLLGTGKANSAGSWNVECELANPYNLSTHSIYAEITTPAGNTLTSESKTLTYDINALQVSKVTMYHWNPELNGWKGNMETSVFDFLNPKTTATQWTVYYPKKIFTYTIEFTNNDPERISNVILYVHTADGKFVPVNASFDEKKGMWYAEIDMGTSSNGYYPVNCSVDFDYVMSIKGDRSEISDKQEALSDIINETKAERENLISEYYSIEEDDENVKTLQSLLCNENADEDEINGLLDIILGDTSSSTVMLTDDEITTLEIEADKLISEWNNIHDSTLINQLLEDCFDDPSYDYKDEVSLSIPTSTGTKLCKKENVKDVDEENLVSAGYIKIELNDESSLYYSFSENSVIIVDVLKKEKYSIVITELHNELYRYASNRANIVGYLTCGTKAINTIKDICSKVKGSSDNYRKMAEIAAGLLDVKNDLACYYEGLLADLIGNITKAYDNANKIINADKKVYKDLKDISESKLIEIRKDITELEGINNSYKHDLYILNGKESLTDAEKTIKATLESQIKEQEATLRELKADRQTWFNKTRKYEKELKKITNKGNIITKHYIKIKNSIVGKLPAKLTNFAKLPTTIKVCGKLAGTCGIAIQVITLYISITEIGEDAKEWLNVMDMIDSKLPCEPDGPSLKKDIYKNSAWHIGQNLLSLASDASGILIAAAGGVPASPLWWIDMAVNVLLTPSRLFNSHASVRDRNNYIGEINSLKCDEKDCGEPGMPPCPKPNPGGGNNGGGNKPGGGANQSGSSSDNPIIDPSGYVYEAVPENRVEGVQATIYYKETKEDMYGDLYEEIILWNAEEYAQKNPLFTDENGMYRWDVPQGLWQVKFEKDGYQTTYSEWLPVPPPQLEVNIGIVQNKQPEVTEARAYEEGVEVQFDKFMDLSTLTTDNIYVTANGEKLGGEIRFIDSSIADEFASEDDENALRYASRVRFVPEKPLSVTTGEIRVTVSRNVLSYAGIPMTETFSQVLDVEKEVQVIYAENVKVLYGGEKEVTVYAVPFEAAVGRTLHIANSSNLIASVDITEAVLDDEGKATVKVNGELPGCTQLTFTIDDVTATGACTVDVVTEIITAEAPKSSRASGTAVYRGTKIELTTESKDAVIYFTTDGSCPCDEDGTRRKYTVPIIINEDTKILAMASVGNNDDDVSEIVEFNYTLKHADMEFQMEEGWTWISHNFENGISASALAADEGVSRILSQTKEVIRDPELGMVGTLNELSAVESYKVEATAATSLLRLSDIARNPATPIGIDAGWNWIGYPIGQTMSVDEAFATTAAETLDVIVGQEGFAQFDGEKWVGTLETMSPGMGYMYQSQSAKDIIYNTSIVSTASAMYAAGISKNLPLVLDIHKYGQIMPVIATISNADGSYLDNEDYQVAAFCGSECRGIGRVVDGLVMMNVYGNIDDNITFQISDTDGERRFSNTATLNFSETVVGDIFNPYSITISNTTDITDVKYSGSIEVEVVNEMLKFKGINTDDIELVEVYDLNGTRLLRETNVPKSGIRVSTLIDGVYIVIVNGNGEYTYHKIAIR